MALDTTLSRRVQAAGENDAPFHIVDRSAAESKTLVLSHAHQFLFLYLNFLPPADIVTAAPP